MRENREENLVSEMFSKQGYTVVKEPDGNIPPDIVLDGTIAVEVTRLSKILEVNGLKRSIDNDSSSIIAKLKKVINSCDDYSNYKYSVHAILKRPFGDVKNIVKSIKSELQCIQDNGLAKDGHRVVISESVTIKIYERNLQGGKGFLLTGINDLDAGYQDSSVISDSVFFCLESKVKKVEPYVNRYSEWWLVLSDTITYDSISEYKKHLETNLCKSVFSKILFVNSLTGALILEI
ncbi:hypothetical protein [Vibrio sp. ZF57]|uniref:hypothetical protein n=1 Tax=Vibrio sp. ZF57 TaxID=1840084 RepID=UPI00080D91A3|nr:hypothetical protein [Vibrio sp. ZF57]OCH51496.1 hypothetical protein A6D97_04180 [Vibrio sp. ZF57]